MRREEIKVFDEACSQGKCDRTPLQQNLTMCLKFPSRHHRGNLRCIARPFPLNTTPNRCSLICLCCANIFPMHPLYFTDNAVRYFYPKCSIFKSYTNALGPSWCSSAVNHHSSHWTLYKPTREYRMVMREARAHFLLGVTLGVRAPSQTQSSKTFGPVHNSVDMRQSPPQ